MLIICLLLSRAICRISTRSFYSLWIRASGVTLVFWAATFTAADSWIAQTGLTLVLVILLVGGIVLLLLEYAISYGTFGVFSACDRKRKAMLDAARYRLKFRATALTLPACLIVTMHKKEMEMWPSQNVSTARWVLAFILTFLQ